MDYKKQFQFNPLTRVLSVGVMNESGRAVGLDKRFGRTPTEAEIETARDEMVAQLIAFMEKSN